MNLTETSTLVTAVSTAVYTIGTFLLWIATRNTARLVAQELKSQRASNRSVVHHATVDAHRDIFLELIRDKDLCALFAKETGLSIEELRSKFLATLLINHTRRIYMDAAYDVSSRQSVESFEADAKELFKLAFIQKRWEEVRPFHPKSFINFIENKVLKAL